LRTPALFALIFFVCGILLAANTSIPALAYVTAASLATALAIICHLIHQTMLSRVLIAVSAIAAGGFLTELQSAEFPANHVSHFASLNDPMTVVGFIDAEPDIRPAKTFLAVAVESLECRGRRIAASGLIRLQVQEPTNAFNYRDRVRFTGYVNRPQEGRNPGAFNYRRYLAIRGITAQITLRSAGQVQLLASGAGEPFVRTIVTPIRNYISLAFERFLPAEQAAVMKGFLIGDVRYIPSEVYERFKNTGTLHVLAASGANVGYAIGVLVTLLAIFRVPRQQRPILLIIGVVIFSFLAYNQPSVVRASVMAIAVLVGKALYRDTNWLNIIAFAGLAILAFRPLYLYDLGFQLSFAAAFSLILFMPSCERLLPRPRTIVSRISRYFLLLLLASIVAQLGVMPILIFNFNTVPLVSFIANLVVVPLVAIASMLGIVFVFSSAIPLLSTWIAYLLSLTLALTLQAIDFFHALPIPSLRMVAPHLLVVIVYYVTLHLGFTLVAGRKVAGSLIIILLICLNALIWKEAITGPRAGTQITFLDTGSINTVFLERDDHERILINGGGRGGSYDRGERTVLPFLRSRGVDHLDRVIATSDAEGNLASLGSVLQELEDIRSPAVSDSLRESSLMGKIEKGDSSLLLCSGEIKAALLTGGTPVQYLNTLPHKLDILGVDWRALEHGGLPQLLDSIQVGTVIVTNYSRLSASTDRIQELRSRYPQVAIYSVLESGAVVITLGKDRYQVLATANN
jgi:competence protein ComEC